MTEFSQELLGQKLAQCAETLALLKEDRETSSLNAFRKDPNLYHAVCFRFVTVIESLFVAGQIVLASRGKHAIGEDSIPVLLAREGVISDDVAHKFSRMYGFRNRFVHAYGTLDDEKVAAYLAERLGDVEELLALFQKAA